MNSNLYVVVLFVWTIWLNVVISLQISNGRLKGFRTHPNQIVSRQRLSMTQESSLFHVQSKNGIHTLCFEVAGKSMSLETGKIGRQAGGAVVAKIEDTIVYSTVCAERTPVPMEFTPLRVDFFARYSAVGQTIGAFHRRDSRGDDTEILVARLIDRPIRPMLHEGWQHDTQILSWVLSYDKKHSFEPLAICASSAAMAISEVPYSKPIAGVEIGLIDGEIVINPTKEQAQNSTLQITMAGTKEGILMIEGFASFVPDDIFMNAMKKGHKAIEKICDAIDTFSKVAGKKKRMDTLRIIPKTLLEKMDELFGSKIEVALSIGDKQERGAAVSVIEQQILKLFNVDGISVSKVVNTDSEEDFVTKDEDDRVEVASDTTDDEIIITEEEPSVEDEASELPTLEKIKPLLNDSRGKSSTLNYYDSIDIKISIKKLLVRVLRRMILETGRRSDGRSVIEVRPIDIETSILPGAHGSTLFTRGETQTIATATLGSKGMEAKFETLDMLGAKRFYLQYKFPPSSVGEVGRVGAVSRREVGHGNLAERALLPSIPSSSVFPYSIRTESLITESCGSSSMATVCGCSLAMLDAGVPVTSLVAGVAMGLILGENENEEPVILTDILGLEDALGTMDFKVAGNDQGITTFQLDIKNEGLTLATLEKALYQARAGRLHVLNIMKNHLSTPKPLKESVPKMLTFSIDKDLLGKVIGPKGKTIQSIIEASGVKDIILEDDGLIQIESFSLEKNEAAKDAIMKIVEDEGKSKGDRRGRGDRDKDKEDVPLGPPPEVGMIYRNCEIVGVHNFGVFVKVLPGYEGLVHISELDTKRVADPASAGMVVGNTIDVKCLGHNDKGQLRLSRRQVLMRDSGSSTSASGILPTDVNIPVVTVNSKNTSDKESDKEKEKVSVTSSSSVSIATTTSTTEPKPYKRSEKLS